MKPPPHYRRFSLFPKSLSHTLAGTLKPIYKKHGFAEHRILTQWNLIVGPQVASYSLPQKLTTSRGREGGTLHILVASGRALELQHMQPLILGNIATYFGYAAVTRLSFTQTSAALFRKEIQASQTPKAAPTQALIDLTNECEDEGLRSALLSLGATLTAVEK